MALGRAAATANPALVMGGRQGKLPGGAVVAVACRGLLNLLNLDLGLLLSLLSLLKLLQLRLLRLLLLTALPWLVVTLVLFPV